MLARSVLFLLGSLLRTLFTIYIWEPRRVGSFRGSDLPVNFLLIFVLSFSAMKLTGKSWIHITGRAEPRKQWENNIPPGLSFFSNRLLINRHVIFLSPLFLYAGLLMNLLVEEGVPWWAVIQYLYEISLPWVSPLTSNSQDFPSNSSHVFWRQQNSS